MLRSLGPEDVALIPILINSLHDEKCGGRFWILIALEDISPYDPVVFASVAKHSRDPDEHLRGETIRYLGQYGAAYTDIAVPALARAARLRSAQDFVSNVAKAFIALVRLAGWKEAWLAMRREKDTGK